MNFNSKTLEVARKPSPSALPRIALPTLSEISSARRTILSYELERLSNTQRPAQPLRPTPCQVNPFRQPVNSAREVMPTTGRLDEATRAIKIRAKREKAKTLSDGQIKDLLSRTKENGKSDVTATLGSLEKGYKLFQSLYGPETPVLKRSQTMRGKVKIPTAFLKSTSQNNAEGTTFEPKVPRGRIAVYSNFGGFLQEEEEARLPKVASTSQLRKLALEHGAATPKARLSNEGQVVRRSSRNKTMFATQALEVAAEISD